jgi:uncharacterized membrane protein YfcA
MPQQVVFGTTLLSLVLPSAITSASHWRLGNVVKTAVIPIVIGAMLGANAGSLLSLHLTETQQQRSLAAVLLLLAIHGLRK